VGTGRKSVYEQSCGLILFPFCLVLARLVIRFSFYVWHCVVFGFSLIIFFMLACSAVQIKDLLGLVPLLIRGILRARYRLAFSFAVPKVQNSRESVTKQTARTLSSPMDEFQPS
jgi:hypothetical protein